MFKKFKTATVRLAVALLALALILPCLGANIFATEAETVKLTSDSSTAVTVASGENKILDLAGHKLSAVVTNNGTLTVIDSVGGGKIGFTTDAGGVQAAIVNNGTLIFDGGAIELIGTGGSTQAVGVHNKKGASMSVKSGTIEAITNGTYWSYSILNEGGTITEISGGTIRAIKNNTTSGLNIMCINNKEGGVIDLISGGEIYAYAKSNNGWAMAIRNQGGARINKITGGIIRAEVDGTGSADCMAIRNENGYIGEISGGLIEGITQGKHDGSEAVGLNNIGGQTVEKITGGIICAKALGNNNNGSKSFALRNEGGAIVKEISGGIIQGYTNAGEWTFGIDNWENGIINKISGGYVSAHIDHTNRAPNGIAIANKGRIDVITGGTFYAETRCNDGSAMGMRNQHDNATVTTISGGTFYARAVSGNACKAYGIYNQNGTIGEIKGDAEIIGHTTATQYSFGVWNDDLITTISDGTFVGKIERSSGGYNSLAISNDNGGIIKNITGGVFYSHSTSPDGDTFAVRSRNNAKIESITGGAFYINKQGDNRILRVEGSSTASLAGGYVLTEKYSENGYKYVIPTDATVSESYSQADNIVIAQIVKAENTIASYKLYGTQRYYAAIGDTLYASVEEALENAKEAEIVRLVADCTDITVPENVDAMLDLDGFSVGNITVADSSHLAVKGGFVKGELSGDITVGIGAYASTPDASSLAEGLETVEKAGGIYTYVISEDGKVTELYDGLVLISVRFFDKDGAPADFCGSAEKKGLVLVGWSEIAQGKATVADKDVDGSVDELYAVWAEKPLYYFLGSSVTYGSATGGHSFVEEIAELYPVDYNKQAISGTTLVDNGSSSYVQRLVNNFDPAVAPQRLIVQLSTNDASQNKPLGSVSSSMKSSDFDKTTIIGAMEFIIAYARETWNAPVSFYTNPCYNNAAYEAMIDALYDLKDKWDIEIFDFYNYVDMEELPASTLESYMSDSIHPNAQGYKWMAGVMGKKLMELDHKDCTCLWSITKGSDSTEDGAMSGVCALCGNITITHHNGKAHGVSFYYQASADGSSYRIVGLVEKASIADIEGIKITFSNGTTDKSITVTSAKAYSSIDATFDGATVTYIAEEGSVILGWVITGIDEEGYAPSAVAVINS